MKEIWQSCTYKSYKKHGSKRSKKDWVIGKLSEPENKTTKKGQMKQVLKKMTVKTQKSSFDPAK